MSRRRKRPGPLVIHGRTVAETVQSIGHRGFRVLAVDGLPDSAYAAERLWKWLQSVQAWIVDEPGASEPPPKYEISP